MLRLSQRKERADKWHMMDEMILISFLVKVGCGKISPENIYFASVVFRLVRVGGSR